MARGQFANKRRMNFRKRRVSEKVNLEELIIKFIEAKEFENRSIKTIKTYKQTLHHFYLWFEEHGNQRVEEAVIKEYLIFMKSKKEKWDDHEHLASTGIGKGLSIRTINNIIRNMRVFFNWTYNNRLISSNPMSNVKNLKEENDTFEVFTDSDIERLLKEPNIRMFTGFRNYVMMLVLIDTGVRISELVNIKVQDVDFKLSQIVLPGRITKNRSLRVLPISKKTQNELENLLDYINISEEDYLFLNQYGEQFHADSFAKTLRDYGKKAGITVARCSPHTFRHYFAVKYLRSGGDAFSLMRILGHSDMTMTNRYVRYADNEINEIHKRASPVENIFRTSNVNKKISRKKLF
ncbi:tyrosine-type recombinase/integrase [Cytobacillus kochii]|uniref:tyrosine-type recombinase/integrase n=1 Tax=Cytobacillus kochii TaxID=859143 RepID=UPI001CD78489|nr:tyrosine-type recombinase/integrase [Cytobacillus kochii]MCA1027835.1 tyrosine-type recombinase/integrase [Cytobacillus kochii]